MPIYVYECSYCNNEFDEYHSIHENSGKTHCNKCGNTAFKIPAIFNPNIFKQRTFGDGTKTPDFVATPKQEKNWMKSQNITYDAPTKKKKEVLKENRERKIVKDGFYGTQMEHAFKKAYDKCKQGYKIEKPKEREGIKGAVKSW